MFQRGFFNYTEGEFSREIASLTVGDRECYREIAFVVPCGIENALERLFQLYRGR